MRPVLFVPLLLLSGALAVPGSAQAQTYGGPLPVDPMTTASTARANYGGGFIEMLMTGRDPSPQARGGAVQRHGRGAGGG